MYDIKLKNKLSCMELRHSTFSVTSRYGIIMI